MEGRTEEEKSGGFVCFVYCMFNQEEKRKRKKKHKKTRNCIIEQNRLRTTHLVAALGTSTFSDLPTFGKVDNDLECQWLDFSTRLACGIYGLTSVNTHGGELVGR